MFSEMCCPNTTSAEITVNCWPACRRLGGRWLAEIAPSVTRGALIYHPQTHTGQYFESDGADANQFELVISAQSRGMTCGRPRGQPAALPAQGVCSSETAAGSRDAGAGIAFGGSFSGGGRGSAVLLGTSVAGSATSTVAGAVRVVEARRI